MTERILLSDHIPALKPVVYSPDSFRLYIQDICQYPLLTPEEEIFYGQRIERGKIARYQLAQASEGQVDELNETILTGLEAAHKLLVSNLRLPVFVAKRYLWSGLPYSDLIQEGNIGLQKSAADFNWRLGFKFSSFAVKYIRGSISRFVSEQSRSVRLPPPKQEEIRKLNMMVSKLEQELGGSPTEEELAEALDIEPARVRQLRQNELRTVSLDSPIGDGDEYTLAETIRDETVDVEGEVTKHSGTQTLEQIMEEILTPKELFIINSFFGLKEDGQTYSLSEIAKKLGCGKERVRQIHNRALRKMRHPWIRSKLREIR